MIGRMIAAHRSAVATAVSGTVVAALVASAAILSSGYTAQRMDLDDGAVWVVNDAEKAIGRASTAALELNSVIPGDGAELQVVQQGATVLLVDRANASLDIVDPATSERGDTVALPPEQPEVWLAGSNAVIMAHGTGEVWVAPLSDLKSFDPASPAPLNFGRDAVASVTADGILFAYGPETGEVYRVDARVGSETDTRWTVDLGDTASRYQISSVGERWAVLDATEAVIAVDGARMRLDRDLADTALALQAPSAEGDAMLVAHEGGLISVPLAGGEPEEQVTEMSGTPAPPTIAGDCIFAAWSGAGAWRDCAGGTDRLELEGMVPAANLRFAVNDRTVVLNDARGGASWAVQKSGQLMDNWTELLPEDENRQTEENDEDVPPVVEPEQQPPVALDDDLGARPGRSSVLPVLLNDYDPNGDVLVVSDVEPIPESTGRVDRIADGQQLLISLTPGAAGAVAFRYTVTDGRGGSATAVVTVGIRAPGENGAPVQARTTKTTVPSGGQQSTQVLGDWVDPDGDAVYLESASVPPPDRVTSKPEGVLLFTDSGEGPELKSVTLAVSDGTATGTGSLAVTVRPIGEVPIIIDDFVVPAYADQEVTVSPLEHVRGGNGPVRLNAVPERTGVTIVPSFETGTFTFRTDQVRVFYIEFVVTDDDQTATGLVRIDVAAPPDATSRPVAIPKTVFVRSFSSESVDVAGSDYDPAGGVLLVTGITAPAVTTGVRAEILEQRSVRVTLTAPLEGAIGFAYTISNGVADAQGSITVVEIPPPAILQPPVARDDAVTVRVGDSIDIPVLDNDEQPDGGDIVLLPDLASPLPSGAGLLFAATDRLRYLAPRTAGNYTASYAIEAADGQQAQATVRISVREKNRATNAAPVPQQVTARVLAGETVKIRIPLTGIDPDGDSVQLLGQQTNPEKGSVISVVDDEIEYRAGPYSAGTDTFSYAVTDGLGARATGTIRVGISPRLDGGRNPVAVEDEVTVRPGTTVTVQVLANDSDPDGGALRVDAARPNTDDTTAEVVEERFVRVTPPRDPGRYGVVYTISTGAGGTSSAFLTVVVDPEAPLSRPVARDTVLGVSDVIGRDSVDVRVLDNVFFADGDVGTLGVQVVAGFADQAEVLSNKRIRVAIGEASQIIPFAVSHPDDPAVRAYAFLRVPGYDDALPQLDSRAPDISVVSEETVRIDLDDYVVALGGGRVRLTDSSTVTATHADGSDLVIDDHTLAYTSADRYFGLASISFEVTDGDPTDPDAARAVLALPIIVEPRENQPPVFSGAVLEFEPGQQRDVNLVRLTNYPYDDDLDELVYSIDEPLPVGFRYQLNGQRLVLTADESAPKNSSTSITVGVADAVNAGRADRIQLRVVASTRPLAGPAADAAAAQRGQTTAVDVLANDQATNPFPGQPLRVVAIRGLEGSSLPEGVRITPSADSERLAVSIASVAQPGDVNLQYQVADATGDPDRFVWGNVRVSVQDRPDPVSGVRVTEFSDRALRLAWAPGAANNSPITDYRVTVSAADDGRVLSTTSCSGAASCVVGTPGNGPGNAVRIQVVAVNAVGASDPAGLAGTIWSDIIPPPPAALAWTPLDGGLRVTWRKPSESDAASPISYYVVTVGGQSRSVTVDPSDAAGTAYSANVVGGLANGSSVAFSVSARNSAPNSLATWNEATGTGTPAGPPIQLGSPSASTSPDGGTASLGWGGVFAENGRAITDYWAVAWSGRAPTCSVTGVAEGDPQPVPPSTGQVVRLGPGANSWTFSGLSSNTTYSLAVFAYNGQGCTVSPIVPVVPRSSPGPVTEIASSGPVPSGPDTFDLRLDDFRIGSGSTDADSVVYQLSGNGVDGTVIGPVARGAPLTSTNGSHYGEAVGVRVRACKKYPELANPLCSAAWSPVFPIGVPVRNSMPDSLETLVSGDGVAEPFRIQWSWTSAPAGSGYDAVESSCDDGASWAPVSGGPGICEAESRNPLLADFADLRIRITANGTTYERSYPWQQ